MSVKSLTQSFIVDRIEWAGKDAEVQDLLGQQVKFRALSEAKGSRYLQTRILRQVHEVEDCWCGKGDDGDSWDHYYVRVDVDDGNETPS